MAAINVTERAYDPVLLSVLSVANESYERCTVSGVGISRPSSKSAVYKRGSVKKHNEKRSCKRKLSKFPSEKSTCVS